MDTILKKKSNKSNIKIGNQPERIIIMKKTDETEHMLMWIIVTKFAFVLQRKE